MYLLGTLVMPLSHRCFTPFWYWLSGWSPSLLASIAVLIAGDMVIQESSCRIYVCVSERERER